MTTNAGINPSMIDALSRALGSRRELQKVIEQANKNLATLSEITDASANPVESIGIAVNIEGHSIIDYSFSAAHNPVGLQIRAIVLELLRSITATVDNQLLAAGLPIDNEADITLIDLTLKGIGDSLRDNLVSTTPEFLTPPVVENSEGPVVDQAAA